eukprot:scaffold1996_cov377-Prasinococcus_capsulatus_cf.AAC.5
MIRTTTVMARESCDRPSQMQQTPSTVWRIHRDHKRPRIPKRFASLSDTRPPRERAKMFIRPKHEATRPAVVRSKPNWSFMYGAAMLLILQVGTVWQILCEEKNTHAHKDVRSTRDEETPTPCRKVGRIRNISEEQEEQWHQDLRNSSSKVTPTAARCIRQSHNLSSEHHRGPKLIRNKGCQRKTNEEAAKDEASRV